MVYIRKKYDIIKENKLNKFEKLGVLPKAAERIFSNPLNLMWLVPTEGSETMKVISDLSRWGKVFSILLLKRKEDDNEFDRQIV